MQLKTLHELDAFTCLSALQKAIRRGDEELAMELACEIGHTSKAFVTMVCSRLELISHEDIGDMQVIMFVATSCEQARRFYDIKRQGKWRMIVGNAIRAMCRSRKTREGDHFQACIGLPNQWGHKIPEIPDYAYDSHTKKGKAMGRGLEFFEKESTKLKDGVSDIYKERAYEQWRIRDGLAQPELPLDDEEGQSEPTNKPRRRGTVNRRRSNISRRKNREL